MVYMTDSTKMLMALGCMMAYIGTDTDFGNKMEIYIGLDNRLTASGCKMEVYSNMI